MSMAVFILIPLGFIMMAAAVAALFWAVNSGQYDEIEDAGRSILEPEEPQASSRQPLTQAPLPNRQ